MALCVEHVLRRRRGPIVVNCASSRMSEDVALRHGVPLVRSAVGEANVVDAMIEHGAIFGGEGNGGPIDPRVGLVRDSFVGMAQLLDAMAQRKLGISQLAAELPRYAIVKIKMSLAREKLPAVFEPWRSSFPPRRWTGWTACGWTGRPLAVGPRQQHGAGGAGDCRGADRGGGPAALRRRRGGGGSRVTSGAQPQARRGSIGGGRLGIPRPVGPRLSAARLEG